MKYSASRGFVSVLFGIRIDLAFLAISAASRSSGPFPLNTASSTAQKNQSGSAKRICGSVFPACFPKRTADHGICSSMRFRCALRIIHPRTTSRVPLSAKLSRHNHWRKRWGWPICSRRFEPEGITRESSSRTIHVIDVCVTGSSAINYGRLAG